MTSELGKMFKARKAYMQEKRRDNRMNGPIILNQCGVTFTTHNDGAHLVVSHNNKVADYWPGTGKYSIRGVRPSYKHGVFNLLKDLGVERAP